MIFRSTVAWVLIVAGTALAEAPKDSSRLILKDGRSFTSSTVKNDLEYDLYSPFDLIGACYSGSAKTVAEEILLHHDFLDHYGDYVCDVEAEFTREAGPIHYRCSDAGGAAGALLNQAFTLKPCLP